MEFLLVLLVVAGIVFVLPIVSWVFALRTRERVGDLERTVGAQRETIERLEIRVSELRREIEIRLPGARTHPAGAAAAAPAPPQARPTPPAPATDQSATPRPATPVADVPISRPPETPRVPPLGVPPVTPPPRIPMPAAAPTPAAARAATPPLPAQPAAPRVPRPPAPPAPPSSPPPPDEPWFDWESLVGVKLFSAIAGIALVLAAVFFLRYSIEHGWLQPPVRVAIGILVAIGLLVACEMKAARRYPVTANALDAAAIAILFSTFFAAHALWDLIPAMVAFALLAIVTALAVLLSIRRESLFIAVLGLLGGFATPALLSTGENRPIPLFAYLMLLNIGLAWVAYRQRWAVLTALTLVFTTLYQFGWVMTFLTANDLSLAMGIFLVFPIATIVALIAGTRGPGSAAGAEATFERTAFFAAIVPLFFAIYLAAVPEYGARPWLLFGFVLLVDAGLLAVALMRAQEGLHGVGSVATVLVAGIWVAFSYGPASSAAALASCAALVLFYAYAPVVAARVGRPFADAGRQASYAAPLLLFMPAVLAGIEPQFAAPVPLFATLLVLVLAIASRAMVEERGPLYFIAAFFAIAAQGVWSWQHLTTERLGIAVAIYGVFGVVAIAIPVLARRIQRPLEPVEGSGFVLIASLGLLLSLSSSVSIAPVSLWGLALLLAILNAGLFVESAAGRLPIISIAGSLFSWIILGTWWWTAGASVGVLPSLAVLLGLTLVTLGGHAWAHTHAEASDERTEFAHGLYLGLIGHVFVLFLVTNRQWSLPPWPIFGTLAAMTLGTSAVSLLSRAPALHAAGAVAAAVIVAVWTGFAGAAWVLVGIAAAAVVSAYGIGWIAAARRASGDEGTSAAAAAAVLFVAEATAIVTSTVSSAPPFLPLLAAHVVNVALILALAWRGRWPVIAPLAVAVAWLAVARFQMEHDLALAWRQLLGLASALYAVFVAYPLVLGARARGERDPYLAAVLASAMFFFAARAAFTAGGLAGAIGIVPVIAALVLAVLLRRLLQIEPSGERDAGRLALVAGAALAFVTVAIPLQLEHQWITIGWALEGAALAWLYGRVPHRGLLYACVALLGAVFVRLALNPEVLTYEPRGSMRILNWYLYAYVISAAALLVAGWWLSKTDETLVDGLPRPSRFLPAGAVILLFLLVNIEIADYFATEATEMFRFGVSVSQDLTYTIAWLIFGMGLLAAGIYLKNRPARVTAVTLISVTTFKCFLYDLGSFGGLYRVASLVGLAMSLALVALALQKYVLARHEERV